MISKKDALIVDPNFRLLATVVMVSFQAITNSAVIDLTNNSIKGGIINGTFRMVQGTIDLSLNYRMVYDISKVVNNKYKIQRYDVTQKRDDRFYLRPM